MTNLFLVVPYTIGGAIGGLVCGLGVSMAITKSIGENPWDESKPLQTHTKLLIPLSCVLGASLGATKALL